MRARIIAALFSSLKVYTRRVPFHRGRGAFIRLIEWLTGRGWPRPLMPIAAGLSMEFEPSLLGWTIFEKGSWEPEQTELFLSLVKPGDVVFDVGANTGYYALLAAANVGREGGVHAFEMQDRMLGILERNVARNDLAGIVTIVKAGCFSSPGEAFIENRGDPGSARVNLQGGGAAVKLIALDDYAATAALRRLDLILIDAEGADFEILKGASQILARFHPTVIAEVHHLGAFGATENDLCDYMAGFGYAARPIQGEFSRDVVFTSNPAAPDHLTPTM